MKFYAFDEAGIELSSEDSIYFVDEVDDDGWRDRAFYYSMYPAKTNFVNSNVLNSDGVGKLSYTEQEFSDILAQDYNYVYIQTIDKDFSSKYGKLFDDEDSILQGKVYRVIDSPSGVKLSLVNQ